MQQDLINYSRNYFLVIIYRILFEREEFFWMRIISFHCRNRYKLHKNWIIYIIKIGGKMHQYMNFVPVWIWGESAPVRSSRTEVVVTVVVVVVVLLVVVDSPPPPPPSPFSGFTSDIFSAFSKFRCSHTENAPKNKTLSHAV